MVRDTVTGWEPLFSNIQLRHDLQAGNDGISDLNGKRHIAPHDAVNPISNSECSLIWFKMNIARP